MAVNCEPLPTLILRLVEMDISVLTETSKPPVKDTVPTPSPDRSIAKVPVLIDELPLNVTLFVPGKTPVLFTVRDVATVLAKIAMVEVLLPEAVFGPVWLNVPMSRVNRISGPDTVTVRLWPVPRVIPSVWAPML